MNFHHRNLAGAIRTKSFLQPVPVYMWPDWKRGLRRAIGLLVFSVLCLLASFLCNGCTSPLISSTIDIDANGNTIPLIREAE